MVDLTMAEAQALLALVKIDTLEMTTLAMTQARDSAKQKLLAFILANTSGQPCGCDPRAGWPCAEHRMKGQINCGDWVNTWEGDREA